MREGEADASGNRIVPVELLLAWICSKEDENAQEKFWADIGRVCLGFDVTVAVCNR